MQVAPVAARSVPDSFSDRVDNVEHVRSDLAIHAAVRSELRRILGGATIRVHVIVLDGAVTLTGDLDTSDDRVAVARAVWGVDGVRGLADGIGVIDRRPRRERSTSLPDARRVEA